MNTLEHARIKVAEYDAIIAKMDELREDLAHEIHDRRDEKGFDPSDLIKKREEIKERACDIWRDERYPFYHLLEEEKRRVAKIEFRKWKAEWKAVRQK